MHARVCAVCVWVWVAVVWSGGGRAYCVPRRFLLKLWAAADRRVAGQLERLELLRPPLVVVDRRDGQLAHRVRVLVHLRERWRFLHLHRLASAAAALLDVLLAAVVHAAVVDAIRRAAANAAFGVIAAQQLADVSFVIITALLGSTLHDHPDFKVVGTVL